MKAIKKLWWIRKKAQDYIKVGYSAKSALSKAKLEAEVTDFDIERENEAQR